MFSKTIRSLLTLVPCVLGSAILFSPRPLVAAPKPLVIVVTTAAELQAALIPANARATIQVAAGEFVFSQALTVPDGVTLVGQGVMAFDETGLPLGIEPSGKSILRSTAALVGDLLTLGDGVSLAGLVIEDATRAGGNAVAVVSRSSGDLVSASIFQCEIVNPNPSGVAPQGPSGRGVALVTRNPNFGLAPPPHNGAVLSLRMNQSIVRSPGAGSGVLAFHFASRAEIDLDLADDVIGGGLEAIAGISRPDGVTGSSVSVQSKRNLYRSDSAVASPLGIRVIGGATPPIPGFVAQPSTFNSLRLHSNGDRIEGFALGIVAVGGQRTSDAAGPSSSNRVDLKVEGVRLQSEGADLTLYGAQSFAQGPAGDENVVSVVMRHATGSGATSNQYAHSTGGPGEGNRLQIAGSPNAFAQTNEDIEPAPPAEFFTSQD